MKSSSAKPFVPAATVPNRGPAVGPDLTHVAGRFSQRDILESILSPSKVVAENYRNVQVTTTDGRQFVGRVLLEGDFRSEKLRIATEPLRPSTIVEISKRDIDQSRETDTSPMPQGLLDSFQPQESSTSSPSSQGSPLTP